MPSASSGSEISHGIQHHSGAPRCTDQRLRQLGKRKPARATCGSDPLWRGAHRPTGLEHAGARRVESGRAGSDWAGSVRAVSFRAVSFRAVSFRAVSFRAEAGLPPAPRTRRPVESGRWLDRTPSPPGRAAAIERSESNPRGRTHQRRARRARRVELNRLASDWLALGWFALVRGGLAWVGLRRGNRDEAAAIPGRVALGRVALVRRRVQRHRAVLLRVTQDHSTAPPQRSLRDPSVRPLRPSPPRAWALHVTGATSSSHNAGIAVPGPLQPAPPR